MGVSINLNQVAYEIVLIILTVHWFQTAGTPISLIAEKGWKLASVSPETVMQKAEKRLQAILQKYKNFGLTEKQFLKLDVKKQLFPETYVLDKPINKLYLFLCVLIIGLFLMSQMNLLDTSSECLIDMPSDASKWFREPETCDICENVKSVRKIHNISSEYFNENFVNPAKPVVITDGAKHWLAVNTFSFDFFKEIYSKSHDDSSKTCQFFPYKTEFNSLQEALNMSPKRAKLEPGEKSWYIGWSNCNDEAGKILRKHYKIPYFLPNTSENLSLNWIFMGGPGFGAHMHVDNVQYPSWQAQLKGRKLWRLAPPPECYYRCQEMQVTVESGEIIVVDTNRWYHQTFVLPGEISITIGSEFD